MIELVYWSVSLSILAVVIDETLNGNERREVNLSDLAQTQPVAVLIIAIVLPIFWPIVFVGSGVRSVVRIIKGRSG